MQSPRHVVAICGAVPKLHQRADEFYADRRGLRVVRIADYEAGALISERSGSRLEFVQAQLRSVLDEPSFDPVVILDLHNDDEVSEVTTMFPAAVVVELIEPTDDHDPFGVSTIRAHQLMCVNDSVLCSFLESLLLTHPGDGAR